MNKEFSTLSSTSNNSINYKLSLLLITLTTSVLLFFCITSLSKGDEAYGYLKSLDQSYNKWPYLDLSPYWTISSFYLWIVSSLHWMLNILLNINIIVSGRIFSLICWISLITLALREQEETRWKVLIILFNPYFLVFATRAHPLVPAILLSYLFWSGIRKRSTTYIGLLLTLAVNFQVYTGGASAMFLPTSTRNLTKVNLLKLLVFPLFAVSGVLITWLTWGGIYPEQFINHSFYSTFHVNGKPSFGYISTILLLAGMTLFGIGERSTREFLKISTYNITVITLIIICAIILYFTGDIIGIASHGSQILLGKYSKIGWITVYSIIGLGWLRVHRDHLTLLAGLLGSGVLLVTLPYFYERITIFATLAPCLAWCLRQDPKDNAIHEWRSILFCTFFLILAILYQFFGSL